MLNKKASNYVKETYGLEKEAAVGAILSGIYAAARMAPKVAPKLVKLMPSLAGKGAKAAQWLGKSKLGQSAFGKSFAQGLKSSKFMADQRQLGTLLAKARGGDRAAAASLRKLVGSGTFKNAEALLKQKNPFMFSPKNATFAQKAGHKIGSIINPNNWNTGSKAVTDMMAAEPLIAGGMGLMLGKGGKGPHPNANMSLNDYANMYNHGNY